MTAWPKHNKPYLTIPEVARVLGESRTAVYTRAVLYGHINGIPVIQKTPSQNVVSRKALEDAIAGKTDAPEPAPLPWDAVAR